MSVVISQNVVMSGLKYGGSNAPVIGWYNLVSRTNVNADYADQYFPVSNLGNPSTASQWRSTSTAMQKITVAINATAPIDYVGIARHNLGSDGATVSVHVKSVDSPSIWTDVFSGAILPNNKPAILRFDPVVAIEVKVTIVPISSAPRIGVLYVGKLTVMPVGMQQEPVALPYANDDEIVTGQAESGDYLGRIVTRQSLSLEYEFLGVEYDWYHANMGPFTKSALTTPFFFAWLPKVYPDECGFGWLNSDVRPVALYYHSSYVVNFSLNIGALAV